MRLLLVVCFLAMASSAFAGAQPLAVACSPQGLTSCEEWVRWHDRHLGVDGADFVGLDAAGSVFVAGITTTGPGFAAPTEMTLLKYTVNGRLAWTARLVAEGGGQDRTHGFSLSDDGRVVFVAGEAHGADGPLEPTRPRFAVGAFDAASGTELWRIVEPGSAYTLATTDDGDLVVAGRLDGAGPTQAGGGMLRRIDGVTGVIEWETYLGFHAADVVVSNESGRVFALGGDRDPDHRSAVAAAIGLDSGAVLWKNVSRPAHAAHAAWALGDAHAADDLLCAAGRRTVAPTGPAAVEGAVACWNGTTGAAVVETVLPFAFAAAMDMGNDRIWIAGAAAGETWDGQVPFVAALSLPDGDVVLSKEVERALPHGSVSAVKKGPTNEIFLAGTTYDPSYQRFRPIMQSVDADTGERLWEAPASLWTASAGAADLALQPDGHVVYAGFAMRPDPQLFGSGADPDILVGRWKTA